MLRINNRKRKEDGSKVTIVITILILLGSFLFSYNYIEEKKTLVYDFKTDKEEQEEEIKPDEAIEKKEEPVEEVKQDSSQKSVKTYAPTYDYIGYLEIPKISLKRGFVSIDSKYNNVERNIYIVNGSNYPDTENGNFIIAGHSGTGWKAFFKNLYKLNVGDEAIVTYNGVKYTYRIANIYNQKKTGSVGIYRDYTKKTLTLITCTKDSKDAQTIYIAYIESETNI